MPELPEVESLRRSLIPFVRGQKILSVKVLKPKLVSGSGTKRFEDDAKKLEFENELKNKTIQNIQRVAKHLIFELSNGPGEYSSSGDSLEDGLDNRLILEDWTLKKSKGENKDDSKATKSEKSSQKADKTANSKLSEQNSQISYMVVHLKMTGQMVYQPKQGSIQDPDNQSPSNSSQAFIGGGHPIVESETVLPNKHSHIIFELEKGSLYYNDTRMFGYCLYFKNYDQVVQLLESGDYGYDPLSPSFSLQAFENKLKTKQGVLKKVFLDQKVVTGLGNIYADEVCFRAGVRPYRKVSTLSKKEIQKLYQAIVEIIPKAVSLRGSSVSDYLLADGSRGNYAREHKVYNRGNLNCLSCTETLKKIVLVGRTTVYCPYCQK